MRVLRVVGLDSEADVTYSALHLMFSCDLDRLDALPAGQAQALRAAFGLGDGLVEGMLPGAAPLSLLSEIAGNKPLLCLLDDAQWFDQSSIDALLFAVRRLHNDPIAVIFAVRDGESPFPARGVDSLALGRLDTADGARLASGTAATAGTAALASDVRDRVLAETGWIDS